MSFIEKHNGAIINVAPFLQDDESCLRESMSIAQNHAQVITIGSTKIVPAGAVIPSNNSSAKGILYEDIDVTSGSKPGSVIVNGTIYEDLLPATVQSAAKNAMTGIRFTTSKAINRPDWFDRNFVALDITSAEGTASGDTAITVSNFTPEETDSYYFAVGDTETPISLGQELPSSGWTEWSGGDITAETGKILTLVAVSAGGYVIAYGSTVVVSKS